jgi:HEAT repeat protein
VDEPKPPAGSAAKGASSGRDSGASDRLRSLVARLANLHEIDRAQGEILAAGRASVPLLAEFLLGEPPSVVWQPRAAAAECLGILGGEEAFAALVRVLDLHDSTSLDPAVRLAEEAVRSCAARALGRLGDRRATEPLLAALFHRRCVAAGVVLAQWHEPRALPGLIDCLEDVHREIAAEAIASFGAPAAVPLAASLRSPRLVQGREPPVSTQRRALSAAILGRLGGAEARKALEEALDDPEPSVRHEAAIALAAVGGTLEPRTRRRLAEALAWADVETQRRAEAALASLGAEAASVLLELAEGAPASTGERPRLAARVAALRLLARIGDPRHVARLERLLGEADARLRLFAVRALAASGDEARGALERALRDPVASVRLAAAAALGRQPKRWGWLGPWIRQWWERRSR